MLWLYKFENNFNEAGILETLGSKIIERIMKLNDEDLDIVLARWDLTIETAIEEVKRETNDGEDAIDKILEDRKQAAENNVKYCEDGHRNEKPRGNQKYCKVCKKILIENDSGMKSDTDDIDEGCEYANGTYKRLKIMDMSLDLRGFSC